MATIFISYSREDADKIKSLKEDLELIGHHVWFDEALSGGQKWWNTILDQVEKVDLVVFGLSPDSLSSEACQSELNYALAYNKRVIPVKIVENVNLDLLPPELSEIHITTYDDSSKQALAELSRCTKDLPPPLAPPGEAPVRPPVPVSYLQTLGVKISSREALGSDEQWAMIGNLRHKMAGSKRDRQGVKNLLINLKEREDLYANVAAEIDQMLLALNDCVEEPSLLNAQKNICTQCSNAIAASAKFCPGCGTPVAAKVSNDKDAPERLNPATAKSASHKVELKTKKRSFQCSRERHSQLIEEVAQWLSVDGYDCQTLPAEGEATLVQIRNKGGWKAFVGMSTSLNVVFKNQNGSSSVEIGEGKWMDKAVAGTVSLFVLWPLAITAGIGAWNQMKMPDRVFDFIERTLSIARQSV